MGTASLRATRCDRTEKAATKTRAFERRIVTTLAAVAIATFSTNVRAEPPARLVSVRGDGAASCPDEARLRHAMAVRLGFDPFGGPAGDSAREVRIVVVRRKEQFTAMVEIRDEAGAVVGDRSLESPSSSTAGFDFCGSTDFRAPMTTLPTPSHWSAVLCVTCSGSSHSKVLPAIRDA